MNNRKIFVEHPHYKKISSKIEVFDQNFQISLKVLISSELIFTKKIVEQPNDNKNFHKKIILFDQNFEISQQAIFLLS